MGTPSLPLDSNAPTLHQLNPFATPFYAPYADHFQLVTAATSVNLQLEQNLHYQEPIISTYWFFPSHVPEPKILSSRNASRTLLLTGVTTDITDNELQAELELWGPVRLLVTDHRAEGNVVVVFYDLRNAVEALEDIKSRHIELQQQYVSYVCRNMPTAIKEDEKKKKKKRKGLIGGRAAWAQYICGWGYQQMVNQGTLVLFDLDSSVDSRRLRSIFQSYGDLREVRESPGNSRSKFVEFYDVRSAAAALEALADKELEGGHKLKMDFSRPHAGIIYHRKHEQLPPICLGWSSQWEFGEWPISWMQPILSRKSLTQNTFTCYRRVHAVPPVRDIKYLFTGNDTRTTLMIRNLPNKISQQMMLEKLDEHCLRSNESVPDEEISAYDFMYLPIDFRNKCNLGYAFVNLTTVNAALKLHQAFHGLQWGAFGSRKVCEVTYARLQGKTALQENFKHSKFICTRDEVLPLVFDPPRMGGANATQPTPLVKAVQ